MRHERVKIQRDSNTIHNTALAPWEIPVLEMVFDGGNVTRLGEFVEYAGDEGYPDPAQELFRLGKVYGSEVKGDPRTYAVRVYGEARAGVREMARAIDAAREADEAAARPRRRKRRLAHAADSLLA